MGKSGRTIREMKKMLYLLVIRQKLTHISLAFARKQALILGCPGIRNMHIRHLHISHNAPHLPPPPPPPKKKKLRTFGFQFLLGRLQYPEDMKNKGYAKFGSAI